MRSFLVGALVILILISAQTLVVDVYKSDRHTDGWEWTSNNGYTRVVIGFNQDDWINTLSALDYDFSDYYYYDDDFEIPILVYLGQRPTSGYQVDISRIVKRNDDTVITISRRSPRENKSIRSEETYPFDFVLLNRTELINENIIVEDQYGNILVRYHDAFPGEERIYSEIIISN